ncbi:hypothetical protein HK102_002299, partial [Quaeritorhiza haematococci]
MSLVRPPKSETTSPHQWIVTPKTRPATASFVHMLSGRSAPIFSPFPHITPSSKINPATIDTLPSPEKFRVVGSARFRKRPQTSSDLATTDPTTVMSPLPFDHFSSAYEPLPVSFSQRITSASRPSTSPSPSTSMSSLFRIPMSPIPPISSPTPTMPVPENIVPMLKIRRKSSSFSHSSVVEDSPHTFATATAAAATAATTTGPAPTTSGATSTVTATTTAALATYPYHG